MAMIDLESQLKQVTEAINMIEDGAQSYSIGTTTVTKASLGTLYRRQEDLLARIGSDEGGGAYAVVFDTR